MNKETKSKLNELFWDAVARHPQEAKSHFEIVDPDVWKMRPAGFVRRSDTVSARWAGPFRFQVGRDEFEVYGRRGRIETSQRLFLSDYGYCESEESQLDRQPNAYFRPIVWVYLLGITIIAALVVLFLTGDGDKAYKTGKYHYRHINGPIRNESIPMVTKVQQSAPAEKQAGSEKSAVKSIPMVTKEQHSAPAEKQAKSIKSTARSVPMAESKSTIKERMRKAFHLHNWNEAVRLADQLPEDEDVDAELMYYLGLCFKDGHSVKRDQEKAFMWFKDSAEKGNAAAQYEVGLAYEHGRGVKRHTGEALDWYQKASLGGNAAATSAFHRLKRE